jgi:N-acyl amino acid synthase of PEP-CTERM/exosortase system
MLESGKFKFIQADSEDLKKEIYRLRYKVYVEEFGFEKPEDHPGGLETDEYEPYSTHFAALKGDNDVIGTVRLVHHSEKDFPIEHAVETTFIGEKPPLEKIGEISRLAVSGDFRRRKEDGRYGVESYLTKSEGGVLPDKGPVPEEFKKRKNPVIVMGLYQILYQATKRQELSHWYMITEEKIFRSLKKFGFLFQQIGEPVEYHGIRIPYLGIINDIEQKLIRENPILLRMVLRGLEREYRPRFGIRGNLRMVMGLPHFAGKAWRYWQGKRR